MPVEAFSQGSVGADVRALQDALAGRGFQAEPIDGEFGPRTCAAVSSFQTVQGLPATGTADAATLRALGLLEAPAALNNAQRLPAASARQQATPTLTATATTTAPPRVLSPIDRWLGGEALTGKKTALAVVAYAVLAILQTAGVVGATTPAGKILTVLITAFGALGALAKVDRGIQALGAIAAKPST